MKRNLLNLIALTLLAAQAQGAETTGVSTLLVVPTAGKPIVLEESRELTVKFWLQQLILSALYRDVVEESSLSEWQRHGQDMPRISCHYPADSRIAVPERPTLIFDEALVPFAATRYPQFIYLKHGDRVQRVSKYDPWVYEKLMAEAGVGPSDWPAVQRTLF